MALQQWQTKCEQFYLFRRSINGQQMFKVLHAAKFWCAPGQ
jgi:hypothetical protein